MWKHQKNDIVYGTTNLHPVKRPPKQKKKGQLLPVQELAQIKYILDIAIADTTLGNLWTFCSHTETKGCQGFKKKSICDNTINRVEEFKQTIAIRGVVNMKKEAGTAKKHLCMVVFLDSIWPLFMNIGGLLSKDELTTGEKTNKFVHKAIATNYNYTNKDKYNVDPYPDLCQGSLKNFSGLLIG